jgi:ATP-dependent Lhr-like helicase
LRKEIEPADRRRLAAFLPAWQGIDRHPSAGAGIDRLREVLVPLQGLALPVETWERDVLPRRVGAYSPSWMDSLCASGELVWVGAGALGRSGRVALYFRDDAAAIGPPSKGSAGRVSAEPPSGPEHELLRERLAGGPAFFTDLLADLESSPEALREAVWDLVWAGEVTNDAWAPLRAPRFALARGSQDGAGAPGMRSPGHAARARGVSRSRFSGRRRSGAQAQIQGRWSLTERVFADDGKGPAGAVERRRVLAELLLERYGIVTREQVLAEGIRGGFAMLYDTFSSLETLGICRRGYFIEGMGGAQFALPGAVERLRSAPERAQTLVIGAADPAQPYGAALPWPKREDLAGRAARVAGAYVVLVFDEPMLFVERGGKGLVTFAPAGAGGVSRGREGDPLREALEALAAAVRASRVPKLTLERIDGEAAIGSPLVEMLIELGFQSGPRRLTLSA